MATPDAGAQCAGSNCLPGTGYTLTNNYCGVLFGPGSCSDGSQHTYGFNSADYDGGGTPTICAQAEYPSGLDGARRVHPVPQLAAHGVREGKGMNLTPRGGLATIAACLAAGWVVAVLIGTAVGHDDVAPDRSGAVGATGVESQVRLLRTPATAADAISADILTGPLLDGDVAEVRSARRAQVSATRAFYVVRGTRPGTICTVAAGGMGCTTDEELLDDGLTWGSSRREHEPTRVEGLVVDGVSTVTLDLADGTQLTTTPRDNAFSFATAGRLRALRWMDAGGRARTTPVFAGDG